jgi:hypothetical protein
MTYNSYLDRPSWKHIIELLINDSKYLRRFEQGKSQIVILPMLDLFDGLVLLVDKVLQFWQRLGIYLTWLELGLICLTHKMTVTAFYSRLTVKYLASLISKQLLPPDY